MIKRTLLFSILTIAALLLPVAAQAQQLQIAPSHPSGIYKIGEPIVWMINVTGPNAALVKSAQYKIKKGGGAVIAQGDIDLTSGTATITTTQSTPLAYLLVVTVPQSGPVPSLTAAGGAVVAPDQIQPSMPRPADFDSFWDSKLQDLAAVPANPVVTTEDSGEKGVHYETVVFDNIDGAKIHAQIAWPDKATQCPAVIILQWAGVYGLNKGTVTSLAAKGWLAADVMPHDLPLNQPDSFYQQAADTTLKNYPEIGDGNRNTSYFLKMLLGCVRVAHYVDAQAQWNGKTMVAMGSSQGGFQSIALAGLDSHITDILALVPACCDQTGDVIGDAVPWPYWNAHATPGNRAALQEASRYYDTVNFASRVHVPTLVGIGLVDRTSLATGDLAMFNKLQGPKEKVIMPFSDHHGTGNTQMAYNARAAQWLDLLRNNQTPPVNQP